MGGGGVQIRRRGKGAGCRVRGILVFHVRQAHNFEIAPVLLVFSTAAPFLAKDRLHK